MKVMIVIVVHAGMSGFSMGGVHASMVASLYPGNVACTPLLAPRSASGAFCHGALRSATSWAPLAAVVDEKQQVSGECHFAAGVALAGLLRSMHMSFAPKQGKGWVGDGSRCVW